MIVGMSDVSYLPGVSGSRPAARTIFGQPVDRNRNANVGKALLGTVLGALDVPVQAIGGMHRDVVQGAPTGGQSAGSRALQNYGEQVGGLWSDVFRPGAGQTPLFQPREFDAAGEAAVDRFGLSGAGASAVRGGATALDLLTGVASGGVGGVGRGAVQSGAQTAGRVANLTPETRQLYLNSLLGRLYHGSKDGGLPDVLGNRGPQPKNWFQADTFLTTSRPLASTYAGDANSLYRARVPLDVAENMGVMNLYRDPDRLMEIANSPRISEILGETGANVVRHQSGHGVGMGGLATPIQRPVYAFTEPAGIRMSQVRNSGNLERFSNFLDSRKRGLQIGLDRLLKRGAFDPDNVL
jgi:hypothetical protein